jgi:hypothetical protein
MSRPAAGQGRSGASAPAHLPPSISGSSARIMTINLTPYEHTQLCYGSTWSVADEAVLARQLARVALGQSRHVQKILAGTALDAPDVPQTSIPGAIQLLTVTGIDPWHRDGWIFQVLSWIAACRARPAGIIRAPHMRHADKGIDGLQLEVDQTTGTIIAAIVFEDKATDNPRETIRREVWPEFAEVESGRKDNVLTAEVTSLLEARRPHDVDSAIRNILWESIRRYRVSITITDVHSTDQGRLNLFKGYETVAAGDLLRRQGEVFPVPNLRAWMQHLADMTIAAIHSEANRNV